MEEETDPVMIRVNKQLSYITKSLNPTAQERKNWFYRLRREERELEYQREIQKKIDAKKEMKKMMKKIKYPQMQNIGILFSLSFHR